MFRTRFGLVPMPWPTGDPRVARGVEERRDGSGDAEQGAGWYASAGMARIPLDTSSEAHAAQTEAYRRMSGEERTEVVFRLNKIARETAAAGIRSRHPNYSEERVRFALFRLLLGDKLTRRVWPGRALVDP